MEKSDLECVYIISLSFNEEKLDYWKNEIRSKLIPWYTGPIIGKKGVNGAGITKKWLKENDFSLYKHWQMSDTDHDYWSRKMDPGIIGCTISHYQVWKHAFENEFKSVLILEEDFAVNEEFDEKYIDEIPNDYDFFYLGRNKVSWLGCLYDDTPIGTGLIVKPASSYNLHAYIFSNSGLQKIMDKKFNEYIFPDDEFIPACYAGHSREDLKFIEPNLIAYAPNEEIEIVKQSRTASALGPRINLDSRKNKELYSYWNDPHEWEKKYLSYATRTKEWELIISEEFDNYFTMPLFTEEFCELITDESEHINSWSNNTNGEIDLDRLLFDRIYYEILKDFLFPAIKYSFKLDDTSWVDMETEDFIVKYGSEETQNTALHHDQCDISLVVSLTDVNEYKGGGVYFPKYKKVVKNKIGHIAFHPGYITHKHGIRPNIQGNRYELISYAKNYQLH